MVQRKGERNGKEIVGAPIRFVAQLAIMLLCFVHSA
jgi:hypothetical protein